MRAREMARAATATTSSAKASWTRFIMARILIRWSHPDKRFRPTMIAMVALVPNGQKNLKAPCLRTNLQI